MNTLTQITAFLVVVALSSSSVVQSPSGKEDNFELLILHNNDMHARFEQTSQLSGTCTAKDRDAGKCYGGFPRVAYVVKEARRAAASGEGPPVLYLNAGDTYTGTAWFTIYKWKIAAEFINALQPDAVSLGNHELDEAVEGLVPFIRNLTTPVLAANLILDKVPELEHEPNLQKSIILLIHGIKIGVIGYLTPDTRFLAPKNNVDYEEEIVAIKREVEALKKQGVKIFIALGHSGFIKDIEIAKHVEDIDLVIGGHSNTFLWNGKFPDEKPEYPEGPYPTIVMQPSGRKVPVVQAYAYTKYMGSLHLVFDSNGEIMKYDGTPLLLDHQIPNDAELLKTIDRYRIEVDKINNEVVGDSLVALDGSCRLVECNMGNFITDAVLNYTSRYHPEYSDVKIAVIQGGRIRTSIDGEKPIKIMRGDLVTVLPFSDTLSIVTMNGTVLKQTLEHSVSTWRTIDSTGQFLQMSGMQVTYDLGKPAGSRIVEAKAVCSQCGNPHLSEVKDKYEYKMFMPSFLAEGGDGYLMFETQAKEVVLFDELKCIFDYLAKYSPVNPTLSNRISLHNKDTIKSEPHTINNTNRLVAPTSLKLLSIFLLCISYL